MKCSGDPCGRQAEQEKNHEQDQKSSLAQTPGKSQEAQREAKGTEDWHCFHPHISGAAIKPRFPVLLYKSYEQ